MEKNSFEKLIGKQVKVKYSDEGTTCIVKGTLNEVNDSFVIVNDIVIGLGKSFISCIPREGNNAF